MKKVIFICLLSLSVCLSKPAEEKATLPQTTTGNVAASDSKTNSTITPHTESQTPPLKEVKPAESPVDAHNASATKPQETNNTAEKQAMNNETKTETKSETKPDNKPETKPAETKPTETKPASDKPNEMKPTPSEGKTQNETVTTTVKAPMEPSEAPTTHKAPKDIPHIVEKARGFDGPSFIGGMVLTLGLLAIGFMGFKYYKNQTERNYHTL